MDQNEVSTYKSLSVDWAGGGIISNTEDLLRFHRALVNHTLLKEETFNKWKDWAKFGRGIDYGYGLIHVKFNEIMFLFSKKLNIWGNWGSTSTYMFYNPFYDIHIIGAFNQSKFVQKQVLFMIKVIKKLAKLPGNG